MKLKTRYSKIFFILISKIMFDLISNSFSISFGLGKNIFVPT